MNVILGIISLIFCTGVGYYFSKKYSIRSEFYSNFYEFNKSLKNDISFMQNSLLNFIDKYSTKTTIFYKNTYEYLYEKKEIELDKNIFNDEEKSFLKNYLNSLGGSDKKTQLNYLESVDVNLVDLLNKAKEQETKYKSLYIKIGFLIGLIALIVLL